MNNAFIVGILERGDDLGCNAPGIGKRQWTSRGLAFHQFHYERPFFDSVNQGDVGVVERGQHFGLTLETGHALWVPGEGFG